MKETKTEWLKIGSWVCFALALLFNGDIAIIGIILGYFHKKETDEKAPLVANAVLVGGIFLIYFILGLVLSGAGYYFY